MYPLWQTPWLPVLYVWAAAFLGILVRGRHAAVLLDDVEASDGHGRLVELNRLTAGLIGDLADVSIADILFAA